MSVKTLALAMMDHTPTSADLTTEEQALLNGALKEDATAANFNFVGSESMKAVQYVRTHADELSDLERAQFVDFVGQRFASTYRGAAVQSGCLSSSGR